MKKKTSKQKASRKNKVLEHPLSSEVEFTNREVGWLNFNRRVLVESEDERNPLLERLRFLSISSSNLDEFFMKRVGVLKRHVAYGLAPKSSDGQTPIQQLANIRSIVIPMLKQQFDVFAKIRQALGKNSIHLLQWSDLKSKDKELVRKYFLKNIFPVLTPLSVDPGHPFPFISNLSTSLGVTLKHPNSEDRLFARVKIPKVLPQWIRIDPTAEDYRFVGILDVIKEHLAELFPSMQVLGVMAFRLTRNADSDRDEEDSEDLLEMIEEELRQRRFAEVVRLEHGPNPDPWMLKFLMEELDLNDEDIFELAGELDYTDLNIIADINIPSLKYEPYSPVVLPIFFEENAQHFFHAIKSADQLLHHPYESFHSSVEKFIRIASEDPKVLAIKMTLYRTGDNSPFIKALIRAAEEGKQVVCLVELKARFDEERNIYWAQELENAGVHVVYGVVGFKTHAKTALVVRQEQDGVRCYAHIGTGNYNVSTSRLYTDIGLITANEEVTNDVVDFFHYLTGRSLKNSYAHLLIAPINMFARFKEMIERESEHAKAGRPAQIIAKFNNMEENDISLALYSASKSGVEIDLIVRGFCCLRPGVLGMSERVRVISIIGRFLEHSRLFYFRNGASDPIDGDFYIGSADWMYRNLHARVEAVTPILDRTLKEKCWEILQLSLKDQRQVWQMNSDGTYTQRNSDEVGLHQTFIQLTKSRNKLVEEVSTTSSEN